LAFYAELMNVLPSIGYITSSLYGLVPVQGFIDDGLSYNATTAWLLACNYSVPSNFSWSLFKSTGFNSTDYFANCVNISDPSDIYSSDQTRNFFIQYILNLPCDILWAIDAALYFTMWWKTVRWTKEEEDGNSYANFELPDVQSKKNTFAYVS